jgi:xanthine dehydrogenase molybdenum-binding subunit
MAYNLIGKDFTPMDVEAKVTGRAKYAEDFRADNMVFCKTLTSPIPHAKIKSIDTSAALKIKGVIGVLTADDVPQFPPPALPILAKDEVFYVGDPILAVAAESEELCADAIEAIKIDFEQLPHVVDPLESLFPGGPNARTAGNVAAGQIKLQTVKWDAADFAAAGDAKMPMGRAAEEWAYGDVDAGFKNAKVTIEETFVTGTYSHNCMETRSTFAYWQGGKCFLHGSNQSHTAAIANIARYIDIPPENLVFIAEYCGGGFGSKIPGYPNMAIAALMSKKINRPVMHRITRTDEYGIGAARPGFQGYIKMGFAASGKLLAADMYLVQESGPHATAGDFRAAGNALTMMYQPDACKFRSVPVLTNTVPMGAHRGPGENQFAALVEPMFDKAAKQLNIDRIAIRRINAPDNSGKIGKDRGPLTSAFQKEALDKAAMMFKWAERKKSSGQKNGNKVTGIGIGQGYHSAGTNGFDGLLRITSDGKLHVHTGIGNLGTYSHSATARVAADLLNCDWETVVIERGDTRKGLPFNSPQAGSLSASTQSRTMYAAAMDMKDKLTDIAAKTHGGQPADYVLGKEKVVHKSDASKSLTFQQAAEKAVALGGKYSGKELPEDLNAITKASVAMIAGSGLIAAAKDNMPRVGVTPGLSVSMAEIELDTETGKFEIKDMICVADCGTVLHPLGLGHQISGGNVMGIGMVMERHIYDPKLGIPASVGFHQGKLPTYLDVPVEVGWGAVEKPDPQNPIGVKGVGEPVLGSGASAITSAIADALGGHLFNRTPVTPDMIINHLAGRPPAHKPLQVNTV